VRPEDLEVCTAKRENSLQGVVVSILRLPIKHVTILGIRVGEDEVYARTSDDEELRPGDPLWLTLKRYHVFDKASGMRL
jgi:TOBE domain